MLIILRIKIITQELGDDRARQSGNWPSLSLSHALQIPGCHNQQSQHGGDGACTSEWFAVQPPVSARCPHLAFQPETGRESRSRQPGKNFANKVWPPSPVCFPFFCSIHRRREKSHVPASGTRVHMLISAVIQRRGPRFCSLNKSPETLVPKAPAAPRRASPS